MRLAPLAALFCLFVLALAGPAAAQTFTVTTTTDDVGTCDPGDCSLREALAAANANPGTDDVSVPAGHYVLTNGELQTDDFDNTVNVTGHSARDTIIDANGQSRVYFVNDGNVNLSHVTITGGVAAQDDPSDPGQGGGIFFNGQHMNLDHVAVVGNQALGDPRFGGQGGGIFANEGMTITNSVVSGNVADGTNSDFSGGQGGAIFGNELVDMTNVTISGNQAKPATDATFPDGQGGAIFVNEGGTWNHVTIAGNSSSGALDNAAGGVFFNEDTTIGNSLIAGNTVDGTPENCVVNSVTITEQGHNLQGTNDCGFAAPGDVTGDALLGALGDNGGETNTQALLTGSPAINTAGADVCAATDQRDLPRPALGGCDIGAFEVQPAAVVPPSTPPAAPADKTRPKVTVAGVRSACVSSSSISIRVRASDASGIRSTRVTLDGKRVHAKNKTRFTLKVNLRKLTAGRHVLRIVTVDGAGNRRSTRRTITKCAKPAAKPKRRAAPRFTG
jgi:CSLREA domain-containing protein